MSAITKEILVVDVTRGDCVEDNRKEGKSNTGTYFLCSIKNFDEIESYFNTSNIYKIDLFKVRIYKELFIQYFDSLKNEYIGKMSKFNTYADYILSCLEAPTVGVTLRKNDTRVFMRFVDNTNSIVSAFRHLLYEDLSKICIEKRNDIYFVYPEINESFIQIKHGEQSDLIIEE